MTRRPGVSLTELMIALGIFSVLMATSLGFYRRQGQAFTAGNERMTLMQNLRYGVNALEQNLRTAGIGVPSSQPVLVHAGERVVAFNANYASNMADDLFAVYPGSGVPDDAVSALTPGRQITIPLSTFTYPDSAYSEGAGNSPAETIIFFFALDSTTARLDDFVLYRQVNDRAPELIARNLVETDRPFFTYYLLDDNGPGNSPVSEVPASYVPGSHTEPIHGAPGDTGIVAGVDSVRAVRVTYAATNGMTGEKETRREITRLIRLPNAGVDTRRTCGAKPLLGTSLAAGAGPGHIELSWGQAIDEYTGEMDVMRYVVWRRENGETDWGDPLVSLAPGADPYTYQDISALQGVAYDYAVAAQDCTPQYSAQSIALNVVWN